RRGRRLGRRGSPRRRGARARCELGHAQKCSKGAAAAGSVRYRFRMRGSALSRAVGRAAVVVCAAGWGAATPAALVAQVPAVRRPPVGEVVERVSPAVVNVSAESMVREVDPFFGGLFGGSRGRKTQSLGSGLIIDSGGVVLTNAHVIEGASRIVVTTLDG